MTTLTQSAGDYLIKLLDEHSGEEEEKCIRLVKDGGSLAMVLDQEKPGDTAITHDERKVLVLENEIADRLQDVTIDLQQTGEGERLVLS